MMPGLDGSGLLPALCSDPHTALLPIVLLSARAGEEAKVEGLEAGADDYLVECCPESHPPEAGRRNRGLWLTTERGLAETP